jgi:hypothetical protein
LINRLLENAEKTLFQCGKKDSPTGPAPFPADPEIIQIDITTLSTALYKIKL